MKLLLTSAGIRNKTLQKELLKLLGKPFSKAKLAHIPTAANVEEGDKSWLIDDLYRLKQLGFARIDILDISAIEKNVWLPRLKDVDIIVVGGGNTFHLMRWFEKSGFAKELQDMLKTKVYVGISAGSIAMGHDIVMSDAKKLYYEKLTAGNASEKALGIVPFQIRPHYKSPYFPLVNDAKLKQMAKKYKKPIYALDDEMAVEVANGKIQVVGEGEYLLLNGKNG